MTLQTPDRDLPVPSDATISEEAPSARRGAGLFFAASGLSQVAALLRYVALARLLGPEQLGLAATLVVTGAFFDMISDTGSDRFLIQDRDGDTSAVQKLVHLVYVGRGLLIAFLLVALANPVAAFYKAPRLADGLMILAVSPLILGFLHLDIRRWQRRQDFRGEAICMMTSEAAGLMATVTAAWITHDFTAILYGLITRSVVMVLVSHLQAERRYVLGYVREHAPRLRRFSAPLILTGLMLFIGSQGDRPIVARTLGFKALGLYSAVLLLVYYPAAVLMNYIHVLYVPMIAARRDDSAGRNDVSDRLGGQTLLLALAMSAGFAVVAPLAVPFLYGARYAEAPVIIALIGILQTTRFLIVWPTTVALGLGRSRTVLASNTARLLAFPGAFAGVWLVGGLPGLVAGFTLGELASIIVALILLNRNTERPFWTGFDRFAAFIVGSAVIIGGAVAYERASLIMAGLDAVAAIAVAIWVAGREAATLRNAVAHATGLAASFFRWRSGSRNRASGDLG